MKKQTVNRLAVFFLLVLTVAALWPLQPARAESPVVFMTNRDLAGMGVERPELFWPIQLSRDGRTLLAAEDLKGKATRSGALSRLWLVEFNPDGSIKKSRNYPLVMPHRLQNTMTPDEKGVVILARSGASFWHLDLQTGNLREFVHAGQGVSRFMAEPHVIWSYQGKMYVTGFPMNEKGVRGRQTVALLDPSKTDAAALTPTDLDIFEVYKHFDQPKNIRWVNPEMGFLGGLKGKAYHLVSWKKGIGYHQIATLGKIESMLGMGPFLAVAAVAADGASTAFLYDSATNRKWVAPPVPAASEYDYPFVSEGGETLVLTEGRKGAATVNLLYGRPAGNYTLSPLPGLQNKKKGVIRLSADGSHLVLRNPDGLYYAEIPR